MKKHEIRPRLERCEDRTLLSQAPIISYTPGQIPAPTGFQELRAVLATDHAVYKVGQTVDLRLSLTNRTHHMVEVSFSVSLSALSIRNKAGFVWDDLGTGRTSADLTEHIQFNPGASMTFKAQWTANSKGAYSVHSEFDPAAAPRFFRVIGDRGVVVQPVGKPITPRPVKPIAPGPVMPPIVKPIQPVHDPIQPVHDPIQPIQPIQDPIQPVHNPPPVHKTNPPIYARGVQPIIRPTLTHTTTTTGSTTTPHQLA